MMDHEFEMKHVSIHELITELDNINELCQVIIKKNNDREIDKHLNLLMDISYHAIELSFEMRENQPVE